METEPFLKVEHCSIVEWTTWLSSTSALGFGQPKNEDRSSGTFMFQDCKCCLSLDFRLNLYYRLHISSEPKLSLPFDVTVMVVNGSDSMPYPRKTVTNLSAAIWECSDHSKISKFITTSFGKQFCLCFKVVLQDSSSKSSFVQLNVGDRSSPLKSYLDSRFHFEALSRDFAKLLDDSSSHDVVLKCGDRTFKAHREVLGTRSEVFAAMLQSDMVESKTGLVKIEDMEADVFRQFLLYLYTGRLPELNVETAELFYEAGDKYAVEELKKASAGFLTMNLTHDNACARLILADQHSDPDFRESVIVYMLDEKIPVRYDKWSEFCDTHSKLAMEVLNRFCKQYCSV